MKFPKVLYVKTEQDGDTTYHIPSVNLVDMAEKDERIQIGVYELRETTYVECEVKTSGSKLHKGYKL